MVPDPKALFDDRSRGASADVERSGKARTLRGGDAITIVAWGNTVPLCEKACDRLAEADLRAELIDLRWISPWDRQAVIASAGKTGRLLVVHEDHASAGFGDEVVATVCEALRDRVDCRRVAQDDILLRRNPAEQLAALPPMAGILASAADLLGVRVAWVNPAAPPPDYHVARVIGSSPSDRNVEMVAVTVEVGMCILEGQLIASVEADNAVVDIGSPATGVVLEVHVSAGQTALVGSPLLTLASARKGPYGPVGAPRLVIVRPTQPGCT